MIETMRQTLPLWSNAMLLLEMDKRLARVGAGQTEVNENEKWIWQGFHFD